MPTSLKNFVFIGSALALFTFGACSPKENNLAKPKAFPVTAVVKTDTVIPRDYVTEIHALQNIEIRARVSGYLETISVDEGATVSKGQLLFSINNREYLQDLARAEAVYKSALADMRAAELELANIRQLAQKNIVSKTELLQAENKLESQIAKKDEAQANKNAAQIRLSNTEIRAPFDGVINRIPTKVGSLIEDGTLLTTLSQNNQVFAYFDVSEKEYLQYARNLKTDSAGTRTVMLILADGQTHPEPGFIETIEGEIDESTGNIAFRARFNNPGKILKHGASGKIRQFRRVDNALLIPQKSTFEIQDKVYVYVVDQSNRVRMRNIKVQGRLPHLFIVGEGLREGERIVFEGLQELKADMQIQPEPRKFKELMSEFASNN